MLVVDLFIFFDCLSEQLLRFSSFGLEVLLVRSAKCIAIRLGLIVFLDADGQICDSHCHASALIIGLFEET